MNTLKGIAWRTKYGQFATINTSKYEYFTGKINKTYSYPVVSGDFCCFKLAFIGGSDTGKSTQ